MTEWFKATPLRVINEVGHAWGVRMGTRLRYHICSHVHSPYNSTAKGSRMSPLWLKSLQLQVPEKRTFMPKLWSRCREQGQFNPLLTRSIYRIESPIHTYIHAYIHTYTHIHAYVHTNIYIYTHVHWVYIIYIYIYIIYTCMYIWYIYIYDYIYIYVDTHTS